MCQCLVDLIESNNRLNALNVYWNNKLCVSKAWGADFPKSESTGYQLAPETEIKGINVELYQNTDLDVEWYS